MNFEDSNELITDILVIGGGLGGCFAAIKAAEEGAKVVVFEKAAILRSGGSGTGVHRIPLIHPDYNFSFEEFARLNIEAACGIADEDLSYEFARDSLDRILDLEKWGLNVRDKDGSFIIMPATDICVGKPVIWGAGPTVWHDLKPLLAKKAMSFPNVTVLDRTTSIGLLTEDGAVGTRVIGAVGMETRTGKFVICKAKAVIITSGNSHRLGRNVDSTYAPTRFIASAPPTNCGEGRAMAFRAGASIVNLEFVYLTSDWKDFPHAGIGQSRGVGGKIITGTGAEVTPSDIYRRTFPGAYNTEGPLYIDVTNVKDAKMMQLFMWSMENGPTSNSYFQWMKERGDDITKRPVEIAWRPPATHNNQSGIYIDVNGRSTLEGLYGAGDVIGGGWRQSAAGGFVFGTRGAKHAVDYIKKVPEAKINKSQVKEIQKDILKAVEVNPREGYSWLELEDKIRKILTDYGPPVTNDARLKQGLAHLERIKAKYLLTVYARDPREMLRVSELKAITFMVEALLGAALFRKESRRNNCSLLYKTEYPERDDKNWLKHTVIRNVNGEINFSTKDVKRLKKGK